MKSYELLNNKTSVVIAPATIDGSPVKMRIVRGKRKNDLNTWQVEVSHIKLF